MDTPPIPEHKLFSVGFRCSSVDFIKRLGLKAESYPFDSAISRLDVIRDCIETHFTHFLNTSNYIMKHTQSYEYMNSIAEHDICANMHYQPTNKINEQKTYQHCLAFPHHNLLDSNDYSHFVCCIDRFYLMLQSKEHKMYLHISPLFANNNEQNINDYKEECIRFHEYMQTKHEELTLYNENPCIIAGLFFILVKDLLEESPEMQVLHEWIKPNYGKFKVILVTTNHLLVDGGETFLGTCHEEEEIIKHNILHYSNLNDVII